MDAEEILTRALEPGEKIVWSDRPHIGLWPPRASVVVLTAGWFALQTVAFWNAVADYLHPPKIRVIGPESWLGFGAAGVLVAALVVWPRIKASSWLYAVTDHGRAIVVEDGRVGIYALPSPDTIITSARGRAEFGNIVLRPTNVVFLRVSYPLIALESIRAAAARGVEARRVSADRPRE